MWKGAITRVGVALLKSWAAGGTLNIVGARGASGVVEESALGNQAALMSPMQELSIVNIKPGEQGVRYKIQITAHEVEYTIRQIGLFARLNNGADTLIAIYQDMTGMTVPSRADMPDYVFSFYATVQMSGEGNLVVNMDVSALVSHSTMQEYVDEALAGLKVAVDEELSDQSDNPVANRAIAAALNNKAPKDHNHYYAGSDAPGGAANAAKKVENKLTVKLHGQTKAEYDGSESQEVNIVGQKLVIRLNGGEETSYDGGAAREVDITPQAIGAARTALYTATLTAGGWSGSEAPYVQNVSVTGILASDAPVIDIIQTGSESTDAPRREAWGNVIRMVTADAGLRAYALEKPGADIPIQIRVVR